ncbi:MAG: phosphatidate cytidylyltransferase [Bacteroidota bacterium]
MAGKFSNLASRVAVALVAIPFIIFASYSGGLFFALFVLIIAALALHEFYGLAKAKGADPQLITGIIGLVAIHLTFFPEQFPADFGGSVMYWKLKDFAAVLFLFLTAVMLIELFRNRGSAILNAGSTIFGVMYVGVFLASLIGIRELFGREIPMQFMQQFFEKTGTVPNIETSGMVYSWGGWTIISILGSIWLCDTMAYFGGLSMGKHKLFPRVSPNKSWEGAVWGFFGAVGAMVFFQQYHLPYLQLHQAVIMGVLVGVFGQIGDLIESLLKRDAGVKDSSGLIPGHGGVFDRFDSLIYVAPMLYLYLSLVVLS